MWKKLLKPLPELGVQQEKILYFLALNKNQHIQAIQRGIKQPDRNYASVNNAVKSLEKKGLIEAELGYSLKNKPINLYNLSLSGLGYVLANNTEIDMFKITEAYKEIEALKILKQFENYYGPETLKKLLKYTIQVLLLKKEQDPKASVASAFLLMSSLGDFSEDETKKLMKGWPIPISRTMKRYMNKNMKKFLKTSGINLKNM